jgi:hypothetical protein
MAGTITKTSTNYAGSLDAFLYAVMQDGADFLSPEVAAAYQKVGVRYKEQLDRIAYTANPLEDYTTGNPTFASGADKKHRDIEPLKMTLSGTFEPDEWLNDWEQYAPNGNLTQLMMNPTFLMRVMELALNAAWTQLADLFWIGNTGAGGSSPLRFINGIITKILTNSDSDVTFVTPAGAITQANVIDRFVDMYIATPDKFLKDPNYKYHCSIADYKLLNLANVDVRKTTVGVLDQVVMDLFLSKRIVPSLGFPKDRILGAHTSLGPDSNLVFANYFSLDSEFQGIQIAKTANLGKIYGYRVDFMADAQYRNGSDIIFYKPS